MVADSSAPRRTSEPGADEPGAVVVGAGAVVVVASPPLRLRPGVGDPPVDGQLRVEQVDLGLVRRHVVRRIGDQRLDVGRRPAERRVDGPDELDVARQQDLDDAQLPSVPDHAPADQTPAAAGRCHPRTRFERGGEVRRARRRRGRRGGGVGGRGRRWRRRSTACVAVGGVVGRVGGRRGRRRGRRRRSAASCSSAVDVRRCATRVRRAAARDGAATWRRVALGPMLSMSCVPPVGERAEARPNESIGPPSSSRGRRVAATGWHNQRSCNNGCRRCSIRRSASPTGAPVTGAGEHHRGVPDGPGARGHRPGERRLADRRRRAPCSTTTASSASGAGAGRSPRVSAEDLPEHIPTLRRLFEECGSDFHLSLDLKHAGIGAAVIDVVAVGGRRPARPAVAVRRDRRRARRPAPASTPHVRLVHSTRLSTARAMVRSGPRRSSPRRASTPSTCTTPTGAAGSSPCSTASSGSPSGGTCSTTTSCSPPCGWASTASTATTST